MQWKKDNYLISDDKSLIDREKIYEMLAKTYWGAYRMKAAIMQSIDNSLCFGVYHEKKIIGFARVVTDKVFFSWIMDVVIDESYRGEGLGKWLLECMLSHPDIKNTKQRLATKDAHGFYQQYGFKIEECMVRDKQTTMY
jgi:GNAT superfamily N-acetyltransferase